LTHTHPNPRRWRPSSLALIVSVWAILQLGGLFTPGLLDDVDSVYIQIAREMLQRHNFVTPTIDGIRFFDKPPLMYWMAAGSMHLFGVHDWAARLPLALGVLALLLAVYALGIRFYSDVSSFRTAETQLSPSIPTDRAGLYAALAMATCIGPYLYTRFYIPDILIALWMTLSVHLFLIALDRINTIATHSQPSILTDGADENPVPQGFSLGSHNALKEKGALAPEVSSPSWWRQSALLPCLGFAAVTALNLLTKGFIGLVFPIGFVLLYLAFTRQLRLLSKFHLIPSTLVFLVIAAPWHILAAIRNPPIPMPPGLGLPAHAGWAWFYLYNEHIARFLGKRIPHDYGQVPIPIFWALLLLWLLPWVAFLPSALLDAYRTLRSKPIPQTESNLRFDSDANFSHIQQTQLPPSTQNRPHLGAKVGSQDSADPFMPGAPFMRAFAHGWGANVRYRHREAALSCLLWAGIILGFFTLSSRQEYYHLPALPALALLVGGILAAADAHLTTRINAARQALNASLYFLVPLGTLLFLLCGYFAITAPTPHPGTTLNDVLSRNPSLYDLSLGHVFDLTGQAMGFFRGPLLTVALCMLALGPISHLIRRTASAAKPNRTFAANLVVAAAMAGVLFGAHEGLVRFYPILGSKGLALAIDAQYHPGDLIIIDGELTAGSTLLFYAPQSAAPILLVNGDRNGPWFGGLYPDAPHIFLNDTQLDHLWSGPHRIFLLTYHPQARTANLTPFGAVHSFATSGGKTILTNKSSE
jgi:4-amino-4-deoxy-L-arabinose transferase-like glycosyltransferase